MGLLDSWNSVDPDQKSALLQGLLAGGFGAMAGRGTALQAWGQGGLAGLQGYSGALQNAQANKRGLLQDQLLQAQVADAKRAQKIAELPAQFLSNGVKPESMDNRDVGQPGEAVIPGQTFDSAGYANALSGLDPARALQYQQMMTRPSSKFSTTPQYDQGGRAFLVSESGETKYLPGVTARDKLENVNGVFVDPFTGRPRVVAPQDVNKPFYVGPNGELAPNTQYQGYEMSKAKSGATNVNLKTEVNTGKSLADQVGPMMKDSAAQADAAVKQVDAAQRVVQAIESNKVFAGPGADTRLKVAQIAQTLGVGGKDDAEMLANTRQAVRGLAELTLQGRQQMKGQGAITEGESKLAEKAMSGDIGDLTPSEIKQLAKASERSARFNYEQHNRKMNAVRENPEFKAVLPFYEAAQMIPPLQNKPTQSMSVDDLVNKYRSR